MLNSHCGIHSCPIGVPHNHVSDIDADATRVMLAIRPDMVESGLWNTDAHAQYAVAMDKDNGEIVWHRSADWRIFGAMYGWTRVAKISPDMPCDGPDHSSC